MRKKSVINFIKLKHKIGSTLIWIMALAIAIFSLEVYADKIVGGSAREVANEKTMVRMTAELSKASASDNKNSIK